MKVFIVLAAICAVAFAEGDSTATVNAQSLDITPDNTFQYAYETSNGISAQASGTDGSATGTAKWVAPDGTPVEFAYTADANGYQPSGSIVPVGPPVPALIQKALDYIAAHPPKPE